MHVFDCVYVCEFRDEILLRGGGGGGGRGGGESVKPVKILNFKFSKKEKKKKRRAKRLFTEIVQRKVMIFLDLG